jgi:hypothetical protein
MRRKVATVLSVLALGVAMAAVSTPAADAAPPSDIAFRVRGVKTVADDQRVRATGVEVDHYEHGVLYVNGTREQGAKLRRLGFKVDDMSFVIASTAVDPGYTDHTEMLAEVDRIVAAFPTLASKTVIGSSFGGKDIVALKISDNVSADENEPELLLTANQHAREHLTVEMALFLADKLTAEYGVNPDFTTMVDTREIYIIPMVNPDGIDFDLAGPNYQMWRKNRQPNSGSAHIGTDLNRNWGYKWGCCGGSSGNKSSDTYRGSAAFSAPETKVVRDFVLSRRVGGVQQLKMHLDIHTYSELVLWPFGYTTGTVVTNMTADQYDVHKTIGTQMALQNGYWPGQASGLYVADGVINDWIWADQKIFSFTFEMFPISSHPDGFYPPASVIVPESSRNREALATLSSFADCPFRAIGKEALHCAATDDYSMTMPAAASVAQGAPAALSLSAAKTAGTDQTVTLSVTGLPPASTVSLSSPSILTDGSAHTVTVNTTAATTPGVYTVIVTGVGSAGTVRTARVAVTVTGAAACAGTNGTDVTIPDTSVAVTSAITIAGCGGNGGATARVDLRIRHNYIGDLVIDLVSPTGLHFPLHDRNGAAMDNIDRSYTISLLGQAADGEWKIEARDVELSTTGRIDSWTLTLR